MSEALALRAENLGRRFRRGWALRDCSVEIPEGRVVAVVGPNGAGKSTLLRLAAGLLRPTEGSLEVLGESLARPASGPSTRVGYLDQDRPLYSSFRVREMLHFGAGYNPGWGVEVATSYLRQLGIDLNARVGSLSGGQQAQVALTLVLAKQPELLLLDEPAAALDPLAREELLRLLMSDVADRGASVILSTHALSDVEAICDYVVILAQSRVVLADDCDFVIQSHRFLSQSGDLSLSLPPGATVIDDRSSQRERSVLVRLELPLTNADWRVDVATLEEIVLAYLRASSSRGLISAGLSEADT